jgi:hypothetical protein
MLQLATSMSCVTPTLELHCTWCDATFLCGDAPHDEEGPLCLGCGRGDDLEEVEHETDA